MDYFYINKFYLFKNGEPRKQERIIPQRECLNEDTRRDLRRKNLCFNCKGPWVPSHRCMGKGRYTSSKYFQIAVRKMNWSENRMENYIVQNWNNCHREQLLLPSQESPPSILLGSREVSRDNVPLL